MQTLTRQQRKFYQLTALKPYKYYWRLEPDVSFSCSVTYDPFIHMAKHRKVYGYVITLWEVGITCPSLFRAVADWRNAQAFKQASFSLWNAFVEPSWGPWPFRRLMSFLPHRDGSGDAWSLCHYWSNFEIGDLDFFRGGEYQSLFDYLDHKGGFYYERVSPAPSQSSILPRSLSSLITTKYQWGDAAVHSLAIATLLEPSQVHHFADIGYQHGKFYQCPANSPDTSQLFTAEGINLTEANPGVEGGIGCACTCDRGLGEHNFSGYCASRLRRGPGREMPWLLRWALLDAWRSYEGLLAGPVVVGGGFLAVKRCSSQKWLRRSIIGITVVLGLTNILHFVS